MNAATLRAAPSPFRIPPPLSAYTRPLYACPTVPVFGLERVGTRLDEVVEGALDLLHHLPEARVHLPNKARQSKARQARQGRQARQASRASSTKASAKHQASHKARPQQQQQRKKKKTRRQTATPSYHQNTTHTYNPHASKKRLIKNNYVAFVTLS